MRHQIIATLDVRKYLPLIIASKHLKTRVALEAVKQQVFDLCDAYDVALAKMAPPKEQAWTEEASDALKSCYGVGTAALSTHKDSILLALKAQAEINVQRCAYCMLNDPRTWDHYMPKDNFPEYAVYHPNLLYICFGCNQRKSNYFDKTELLYCHPYFSVDADEALLHCEVTVADGKLAIKYYGAAVGAFHVAGVIAQRHLLRLSLIDRFQGEASSMVSGLIGEFRQHFPAGVSVAALEGVLQRRYAEARSKLGSNAWDSRLWHGLANCPQFHAYANKKILAIDVPSSKGFFDTSPPPPLP